MKKPKTMRGLASEIAKREGRKSQVRIGDIREILGILSDMMEEAAEDPQLPIDQWPSTILMVNGGRRAKRKKK